MKRLFLFVAVAALGLTSCSSDDDKGGNEGNGNSTIAVTIDGVAKTFNAVVNEEDHGSYIRLTVVAGNSDERITFLASKDDLDDIWDFKYKKGDVEYNGNQTLYGELEINSNNRLKGTFSGRAWHNDYPDVYFTNGSFDISY